MFEIRKREHINKTFRMPADLIKEMEKLAQAKNISLNNLVVQCCEYALKNLGDSNTSSSSDSDNS